MGIKTRGLANEENAVAERKRDGGQWVYGVHAVRALLERRPEGVISAALLRGSRASTLPDIERELGSRGIPIEHMDRTALDRLTGGGKHQGVAVRTRGLGEIGIRELESLVLERGKALRLLVLDQVQDPRNLGACLRTADAAGVDAVVVPRSRSAKLTPAAVKAAAMAGAEVAMPPMKIPGQGMFSIYILGGIEHGLWQDP